VARGSRFETSSRVRGDWERLGPGAGEIRGRDDFQRAGWWTVDCHRCRKEPLTMTRRRKQDHGEQNGKDSLEAIIEIHLVSQQTEDAHTKQRSQLMRVHTKHWSAVAQ